MNSKIDLIDAKPKLRAGDLVEDTPYGDMDSYVFLERIHSSRPVWDWGIEEIIQACRIRADHMSELVDLGFNISISNMIASAAIESLKSCKNDSMRRCLEIGCGTGEFSGKFAAIPKTHWVHAEIIPEHAEKARKLGLNARCLDGRRLPFTGGNFECAVALFVMHFPGVWDIFDEVMRVVHSEGCFIFNFYCDKEDDFKNLKRRLHNYELKIYSTFIRKKKTHFIIILRRSQI